MKQLVKKQPVDIFKYEPSTELVKTLANQIIYLQSNLFLMPFPRKERHLALGTRLASDTNKHTTHSTPFCSNKGLASFS